VLVSTPADAILNEKQKISHCRNSSKIQ